MSDAATALQDVEAEVRSLLADTVIEIEENRGDLIVRVPSDRRPEALGVLKSLGFDYYSFCCAVDRPEDEKIEIFDHVHSIKRNVHVTLKCDVPRSEPRLPTALNVYGGADWHERETWELFGVIFIGHPRLRRLLLPDWQEGFPMRKDYVLRARVEKPWPGEFFEA